MIQFVLKKTDSATLLLTALNSFHSNIKFTMEVEKDSAILFLDVLVIKTPNRIHAIVYRKKRILIYIFIGILSHQTNISGEQSKPWCINRMTSPQLNNF